MDSGWREKRTLLPTFAPGSDRSFSKDRFFGRLRRAVELAQQRGQLATGPVAGPFETGA